MPVNEFRCGEIHGLVLRDLRRFEDERGWLTELFRHDEIAEEFYPVMTYISLTQPGMQRGPHEQAEQVDLFVSSGQTSNCACGTTARILRRTFTS